MKRNKKKTIYLQLAILLFTLTSQKQVERILDSTVYVSKNWPNHKFYNTIQSTNYQHKSIDYYVLKDNKSSLFFSL